MQIGLCAACKHAKTITNDRCSTFIMCELSNTDKKFPKYPRLPVLACHGFDEKPAEAHPLTEDSDA